MTSVNEQNRRAAAISGAGSASVETLRSAWWEGMPSRRWPGADAARGGMKGIGVLVGGSAIS